MASKRLISRLFRDPPVCRNLRTNLRLSDTAKCRVIVATCLQRMPLLNREKNRLEKEYETLADKYRMERSRLSDFELQAALETEKLRSREKRALDEDLSDSQSKELFGSSNEFVELQDAFDKDFQLFETAARETDADVKRDLSSLNRKLDAVLYLIVRDLDMETWSLPTTEWTDSETLLEVMQRPMYCPTRYNRG